MKILMKQLILILLAVHAAQLNAGVILKKPYVNFIARNGGMMILFENKSTGKAFCSGPGCACSIKFKYSVDASDNLNFELSSELEYGHYESCMDFFSGFKDDCRVVIDDEEPIYKNKITCGSGGETFYNLASLKPNAALNFLENDVIYLGETIGFTTTAVKVRKAPDVTSEAAKCESDETAEPLNALPPKTKVIFVARTQKKFKVGKWNNYWYFVKSYGVNGLNCGFADNENLPYRGYWLYGEFLRPEK